MTEVSQRPRTAESAAGVVTEFFDRYREHDVEGMTDLCSINADFSYVPVEVWGKQRVVRGDGKVGTVGKPLWTGLIASFPDLSNTVHTITSNDGGDVVARKSRILLGEATLYVVDPRPLFLRHPDIVAAN